jgi:hypothetical protein
LFASAELIFKSPQFFETFSKALHGLERKMNYLKFAVKNLVKARHMSIHAVFPPHDETFLLAVSRLKKVDGATPHFSSIFSQRTLSARSYAIPGEKLSTMFSVELFNI